MPQKLHPFRPLGDKSPRELWIAMIGDMVASRKLPSEQRRLTQERLVQLMHELNEEFASAIAGQFAITQGDEFECLLKPQAAGELLPEILWRIEERFPFPAIRFGIGLGSIDTDIPVPPESAILLDGPAFHKARQAVVFAARERCMGGVFLGFGEAHDAILNGIARLLERQRQRWSGRQREVARMLHRGMKQVEIARATLRTPQAVSVDTHAAGWQAYLEGERAWRAALQQALRSNFIESEPPRKASAASYELQ